MKKITKRPSFQFYPGDWLSSANIMLMTPAEEGAYIRLICIAWDSKDCSLPDDDDQLSTLSRLGEGWFNGGSTKIRKCFFLRNGKLFNERLLKERSKQNEWSKKSKRGGVASGRTRKNKELSGEGWLPNGSSVAATKDEPKGNTSSSSSSSSISNTPSNKSKRSGVVFPKSRYDGVLTAYQQIKGVELRGDEFKPIQQSIKSMFMSDRTEDQIIGCMHFLEGSEESWTGKWTINTVKMKLPDFIAGKLDNSGLDDIDRELLKREVPA